MTIGVILALIDLGFCVFIMYYCCKYEKRLDRLEYLHEIDWEDMRKFRADINKRFQEHETKVEKKMCIIINDPSGDSQMITLGELAEYVLNDEPIVRKADKVIWGKDESKSNI